MFLISWLFFPLTLAALSLGLGLLIARLSGKEGLGALVLPVGFAGLVVVVGLFTYFDATAELAGPAAALLALVGLALSFRHGARLRLDREIWWLALAAAGPSAALAAPVVLTGKPGFTGYARIVDTAFQFDLAAWFASHGRALPSANVSAYTELILKTVNIGYPGGAQAALGSVSRLAGVETMWAWQPFMAFMGGMLGLSLYVLLGRAIPFKPARGLAAAVAGQASITYAYSLTGGIKELAAALFLALAAAVIAARHHEEARSGGVLAIAVAFAAAFYSFNLGILPWLGLLAAAAFAIELLTRTRRGGTLLSWTGVGLLTLALAAPATLTAVKLAPTASGGGPPDLGNLAAPVPAKAAAGVWLTSDHRYALSTAGHAALTDDLIVLVLVLAALGVLAAMRARDWTLVAAAFAGAGGLAYVLPRTSSWIDLKAITLTAPLTLTLAFAGSAALGRVRRVPRWAPILVGCVVGAGVLGGNALLYNGTPLAPYDRLADLKRLGDRYASDGPTLYPAFEEYAEYLLRASNGRSLVDPGYGSLPTRPDATPDLFSRDLDDIEPAGLARYRLLIMRRNPGMSRPPSDWRLVEQTTFHEVWRHVPGRPRVLQRFPVGGAYGPNSRKRCRAVSRALRAAGPQASVAYVQAPQVTQFGLEQLARSPIRKRVDAVLPLNGRYRVWLRGSFGRRVAVSVDGHPVGSAQWRSNYPGQQELIGTVDLSAGPHVAVVTRGGGSPLPGTGNDIADDGSKTRLLPITFEPVSREPAVHFATAADAMRACDAKRTLDWIEVIGPPADR